METDRDHFGTGEEPGDEVSKFIFDRIKSVAELEALLFLFRQNERDLTAVELSRELRTNPVYAEDLLQRFSKLKLVLFDKATKKYKFNPDLGDENKVIQKIEELYKTRRLYLINLIYQAPTEKIKTFADAFKIRS
jgi:hypothetical protein